MDSGVLTLDPQNPTVALSVPIKNKGGNHECEHIGWQGDCQRNS